MTTEKLFSYGTLQYPSVQIATFGRALTGNFDSLPGFKMTMVKINDLAVIETSGEDEHPIIAMVSVHVMTST